MGDALKTLIRVAKFDVDEKQRALGGLLKLEDEILEEKKRLEQEKKLQDDAVKEFFNLHFSYDNYLKEYLRMQKELDETLKETRELIEKARAMLEDAFITLKTYEISDKNKKKKADYEIELKNQKNLDEMGLNSYRLKNKK